MRKIGLPAIVANAIEEKLKREQKAEQMKFGNPKTGLPVISST